MKKIGKFLFAVVVLFATTLWAGSPHKVVTINLSNARTANGLSAQSGESVYEFVKRNCIIDDESAVVSTVNEVLSADGVEIALQGAIVPSPYPRFHFFFVDDVPGANWAHSCHYVFVSEDMSSITVLDNTWFPVLRRKDTGADIPLEALNAKDEGEVKTLESVQEEVYNYARDLREAVANDITVSGDTSKSWFVLISGGATPAKNGIRFWSDTAMFYSTLRLKYGVPKNHIYVFMSDGNSTGADANLGSESSPVLVDSPKDLDGDGVGDITLHASTTVVEEGGQQYNNIWYYFNDKFFPDLRSKLTANDQLFIFVTSHGGALLDGNGNPTPGVSTISLYNGEYFSDGEMQDWIGGFSCPVAVALQTCWAGGFISTLTATANRVVAAATGVEEKSWGLPGGGSWVGGVTGKVDC